MLNVSDRTFLLHLGGKIEIAAKAPLKTRDDLSMAYTPGVARISQAIADDPAKVWTLTAARVVGKKLNDLSVVITGVGAAGTATTRMLLRAGVRDVIGCDRHGALYRGRPDLTGAKAKYAATTNARARRGSADEVLQGADVYIGLSGLGAVTVEGIGSMAPGAIVFAMANPTPEIAPELIDGVAAVVATGRSDYPNQINNVLAFPGIFRGALEVRASAITYEMQLAAAEAIANAIPPDHLEPDYIVPSVFNREVAPAVAAAVEIAAEASGVARRPRRHARRSQPAADRRR